MLDIYHYNKKRDFIKNAVKPAHAVISIKQSPVFTGNLHVLILSYERNELYFF